VKKFARAMLPCVALLVAVLASACTTARAGMPVPERGAGPRQPARAAEATTTPTTTTEAAPPTNERGFIPVKVGEQSCYGPMDSTSCAGGVTFSIDKIAIDPPCSEFGSRTAHTLLLSMRVTTGTNGSALDTASGVFNPFSFVVIGKNGVTQKADFGTCTEASDTPNTYGPNQKYAFKIELEVPVVHGSLALQPGIIGEDGSGGWEWTF
jgi:hypothetical protein